MTTNLPATPSPPDAITRALALAPKLAARASEADTRGGVPDASVADFLDTGLHKLMQPARYGGWAMGWDVHVAASLELGAGDGSQAWALTSYTDNAQLVSMMAPQAQDEVWQPDPRALISASLAPLGKLVPRGRDYVASGRWSAAAGIDHAQWLLGGAVLAEDGQERVVYVLVPTSAGKIVDDWHVMGLAGTGAKSFALDDTLILPHRVLDGKDYKEGTGPGARASTQLSSRVPHDGGSLALACVALGIARGMLDELVTMARDTTKRGRRVENDFATALRLAESEAEVDAAGIAAIAAARETMEVLAKGETPSRERRALNTLKSAYGMLVAARAADRLFAAGGAKANRLSSRLQRQLMDIHAAGAQEAFAWDAKASVYGRLLLGEESEL